MPKNILIFSDGTGQSGGQKTDQKLSNIYKLYRATRSGPESPINPKEQYAFYDAGLGSEEITGPFGGRPAKFIRKHLSSATGKGFSRNVVDCYEAILKTYQPGDKIFLFGFSRGAYTVRTCCRGYEFMWCSNSKQRRIAITKVRPAFARHFRRSCNASL